MGSSTDSMNKHQVTPATSTATSAAPEQTEPKDAAETARLRAGIAQTRSDMSGTIDEIHGKLNPAVLKEQAMDQFHDAKESIKAEVRAELEQAKARFNHELLEAKMAVREATIGKVENMVHRAEDAVTDTSRSIVDTIKDNPIPAALAGIGLAWLFMSSRSTSSRHNRSFRGGRGQAMPGQFGYGFVPGQQGYSGYGATDMHGSRGAVGNAMHQVGETAGNMAHSVQQAAGSVAHQAGNLAHQAGDMTQHAGESMLHLAHDATATMGHLAHDAQASVVHFGHEAYMQGVRLENRFEQTLRDNPLAVGAVALAIGAAIGLAVPSTRKEDELMGQARDKVMDQAQHLAGDALDKVDEGARHLTEELQGGQHKNGSNGDRQSQPSVARR